MKSFENLRLHDGAVAQKLHEIRDERTTKRTTDSNEELDEIKTVLSQTRSELKTKENGHDFDEPDELASDNEVSGTSRSSSRGRKRGRGRGAGRGRGKRKQDSDDDDEGWKSSRYFEMFCLYHLI